MIRTTPALAALAMVALSCYEPLPVDELCHWTSPACAGEDFGIEWVSIPGKGYSMARSEVTVAQ